MDTHIAPAAAPMTHQDHADLTAKLLLPMIVSDCLDRQGPLSDEEIYAMHEVISDMQPDTALLAIALSTRILSARTGGPMALRLLDYECERIVGEYGPLWLENARDQDVPQEGAREVIDLMAEDLESLETLLSVATAALERSDNEPAATICGILHTQAESQALIADVFLEVIQAADENSTDELSSALSISNIVAFPKALTRAKNGV